MSKKWQKSYMIFLISLFIFPLNKIYKNRIISYFWDQKTIEKHLEVDPFVACWAETVSVRYFSFLLPLCCGFCFCFCFCFGYCCFWCCCFAGCLPVVVRIQLWASLSPYNPFPLAPSQFVFTFVFVFVFFFLFLFVVLSQPIEICNT